jgi:hypothetical protein
MNIASTPQTALFRVPTGQNYLNFLTDMHRTLQPEWYLEIGTQFGKSLDAATCNTVAIDPEFKDGIDASRGRATSIFLQQTSDDAFASGVIQNLNIRFNLAFLDGMHLFEYLLRDFINAEPLMAEGGHIVLHDCLPHSANMAERARENTTTNAWTGDVWKLVPILQKHRPDLTVQVFDAAPTGLVVVSNLDPDNKTLAKNYDAIVAQNMDRADIADVVGRLDITPTRASPWRIKHAARPDAPLSFAIQTAIPRPRGRVHWGDFHFANGLAKALEQKGHKARVQTKKEWSIQQDAGEVELVLRGREAYTPNHSGPLFYWIISSDGEDMGAELANADHIFAAGQPLQKHLIKSLGKGRVSFLPQAFDADRMHPPETADHPRDGIVFVGISRKVERPLIRAALGSKLDLGIWGPGWEGKASARQYRAEHLENRALGELYRGAEIVLNDHKPGMRQWGLASNRIYDALACGAAVISDPVASLPKEFDGFVHFATTKSEYETAVKTIRAETKAKKAKRHALALAMRDTHAFAPRADAILAQVKKTLKAGLA